MESARRAAGPVYTLRPADIALLVAAAYIAPRRRRMLTETQELLSSPGADLLVRVRDDRASHLDGMGFMSVRAGSAREGTPDVAYDAAGVARFGLERFDTGTGEPHTYVITPDGRNVGLVARGHLGTRPTFSLLDASSNRVGTATTTGGAFQITAADGRLAGRLGLADRAECVLRLDVPIVEPLNTLVLALAFDIHRLLSTRPTSRGPLALGPGFRHD